MLRGEDVAQVQGNNQMAQFVLTAAADNFSGLSGQFNQFNFTPSTLQAVDVIVGGATGVFSIPAS